MDLKEILRRWHWGFLNGEDLPAVACELLSSGFESPAIIELGGLDRPRMSEAGPIFRRALDEIGQSSTTVKEDPWRFAVGVARRILSRDVGMIEGCREMVMVRDHGDLYDAEELLAFVGVESETDRLPVGAVRAQWSAEALAEADREIAQNVAYYGEYIDEACRRLIAKFG